MDEITAVGSIGPTPKMADDSRLRALQPEGERFNRWAYLMWLDAALQYRGLFLIAYLTFHWGDDFI